MQIRLLTWSIDLPGAGVEFRFVSQFQQTKPCQRGQICPCLIVGDDCASEWVLTAARRRLMLWHNQNE